jgi:hypothetical protein
MFTKCISEIRVYPYKERLPLAVGVMGIMVWNRRGLWAFFTAEDYVLFGGIFLALLCQAKSRPFWFYMGAAAGVFLASAVNLLLHFQHSKSNILYFLGGLLAMALIATLLRPKRSNPLAGLRDSNGG